MKKHTNRILSLLLLLALLVGMLPASGAFRAYATEAETVAAETEEATEVPAVTEEHTEETEAEEPPFTEEEPTIEPEAPADDENEASEETELTVETEPPKETEPPREDDPYEGKATGTIVELEQIQPKDDVLASNYGLQIPVILYGSGTGFTVSFQYPNDTSHTTYHVDLTGFRYHYLNGQMAYCLEPQAGSTPGAVYSQIAGGANLNVWERFLSISQRNAIALALAYGAPNGLTSSTSLTLHGYEAATQVIVWELIIGYRDTVAPFSRSNSGLYNFVLNLCNPNDSTGTLRAAYISGYNAIVSSMQNHGVIPSFASKKQAEAPEHEMVYDAASRLYKIVLTDENNAINDDFPYTSGNGLTFSKSENKLTITATAAALQNQPIMVHSTGSDPDTDDVSPVIWGTTNSNHNVGQILSQLPKPDPVNVYFKLKAPATTTLTIQKVCADGNIGGITFTVKDGSGDTLFTGQTDETGKLDVPNLEIGATVTVTETVPDNYVAEHRTQAVTLAEGPNTVTFRNYPMGTMTLQKTADDGNVEGFCFRIFRHKDTAAGLPSKTWCGKSDAEGNVYLTDSDFSEPDGEKEYTFTGLTDGTYSLRELLSLYGADEVQTESITIQTSGGITPACCLEFSGEDLHMDSNGDCYISSVVLTGLTGGGHMTITIHNKPVLTLGSVTVRKVDPQGNALSGVTFLLEYSLDDGTSWNPVFLRDEGSEPAPGACTSEGMNEGKLTTGSDGIVSFTGLFPETRDVHILYRLTELKTRPGYSLLSGPAFQGSLSKEEAVDIVLTVVNTPEFEMPMTGGVGFRGAAIAAALVVLSAAILWITRRRKATR